MRARGPILVPSVAAETSPGARRGPRRSPGRPPCEVGVIERRQSREARSHDDDTRRGRRAGYGHRRAIEPSASASGAGGAGALEQFAPRGAAACAAARSISCISGVRAIPTNVCATRKRLRWPLRPNRDLAMGRSVQTRCVRMLRGLDPPASGGVASRPRTAMGGIHAHSGCRDRSVPGRLPGRARWRLVGPAAAGYQTDAAFAASAAANGVANVSATTQRVSCYAPEVALSRRADAGRRLPRRRHGRRAPAPPRRARTSARTRPRTSPTRRMRVKDHSESDIRVDPTEPTAPDRAEQVGGHRRGLQPPASASTSPSTAAPPGPSRATCPATRAGPTTPTRSAHSTPGATSTRSCSPTSSTTTSGGFNKYDNGSNQTNPTVPPEAIAVSVHPAPACRHDAATSWITTHNGQPDYLDDGQERQHERSRQAVDRDRHEPGEPALRARVRDVDGLRAQPVRHLRVARRREARRHAHRLVARRRSCRRSRASAGTRTCCRTSRPTGRSGRRSRTTRRSRASPPTTSTSSGRRTVATTWQGPLPVVQDVPTPTYQNTTFREGIVNTFASGRHPRSWAVLSRSTCPSRTARAASRTST